MRKYLIISVRESIKILTFERNNTLLTERNIEQKTLYLQASDWRNGWTNIRKRFLLLSERTKSPISYIGG